MNSLDQQQIAEYPAETGPLLHDVNLPAQLLLSDPAANHTPKSGLNPIADAAANLFTIMGKLKRMEFHPHPGKLKTELADKINTFYETVKNHGYSTEYTAVCRYIMCAVLDELTYHSPMGKKGQWEEYNLLVAFHQDLHHQEKFFSIMERIVKEPALYIDLMEFMYLCLSLEYKGRYRHLEHGQYQLEHIINGLYKHIRAYRGSFSKVLTPTPLKTPASLDIRLKHKTSLTSIFIVTACIILTILVSLSYLMDTLTNEPPHKAMGSSQKSK
jgi:type VI secretion system protein ImpK